MYYRQAKCRSKCPWEHAYKTESLIKSSLNDFSEYISRSEKEDKIIQNHSSMILCGSTPDRLSFRTLSKKFGLEHINRKSHTDQVSRQNKHEVSWKMLQQQLHDLI